MMLPVEDGAMILLEFRMEESWGSMEKLKAERKGSKQISSAGIVSTLNTVFSKTQIRCDNSCLKDAGVRRLWLSQ